jgi:hypothetical protein
MYLHGGTDKGMGSWVSSFVLSVQSVDSFLDCQSELTQNPSLRQLPVPRHGDWRNPQHFGGFFPLIPPK